jgi:hypothetical protein
MNCASDLDCVMGYHCNDALTPPRCQKLYCGANGTPCSETANCIAGFVCFDGVCYMGCQIPAEWKYDEGCDACQQDKCCGKIVACANDAPCKAAFECVNACYGSTDAGTSDQCITNCLANTPPSSAALYEAQDACTAMHCSMQCM